MAWVYVDWADDGRIKVAVVTGARTRETFFAAADRAAADAFAMSKMGRGSVLSTLDMTPAQLEAHKARMVREAALLARLTALKPGEVLRREC